MEWLSIVLTVVCAVMVYLIFKAKLRNGPSYDAEPPKPRLPPFPKGDLTLQELRQYDGKGPDGRVLLAIDRQIYDCTRGSRFYGAEGPYATLAGHDATRALATFNVEAVKEEWDDYSDLSLDQMNTVNEWYLQFKEKYDYVGRLVKTEADKSTPVDDGLDE